jgi:predicted benzoate:H+ symporter BenE
MIRRVRAFGAFWYGFIVGDDWRVAVGVILALAITYLLSRAAAPTWWIVVVAVAGLLVSSVRRASRRRPDDGVETVTR